MKIPLIQTLLTLFALLPSFLFAEGKPAEPKKEIDDIAIIAIHSVALATVVLEWRDAPNMTKDQQERMHAHVIQAIPLWFNLYVQLKSAPKNPKNLKFKNEYLRQVKRLLRKVGKKDTLEAFNGHRASFTDPSITIRWPAKGYSKKQFELDLKEFVALSQDD